jgi:molybdate transport system substrate-binding protein
MEALQTMQLLDSTRPYHITGKNIAQPFQFIASGNTQLGFIALAQLRALPESERVTY